MTVGSAPLRADSAGNGSGLNHPYSWKIDNKDELKVTRVTVSDGTETPLTLDTDYTVTGVGNAAGGNVVIDPALSSDYTLIITPSLDYEQTADFTNQNSIPPEEVESALDRISRQMKQLVETVSRAITVPISETSVDANTFAATMLGYKNDAESAESNAETKATEAASSASAAAASATQAETAVKGALWSGGVIALDHTGSPYTLTGSDAGKYYVFDTSGGNVSVKLPLIADAGEPFTIGVEKSTGDANTVTINQSGSDTIDGNAGGVVLSNGNEARVFSADLDTAPDNWTTANFGLKSGDFIVDNLSDGVGFTAGTSTTITLSATPGTESNVFISFDGVLQHTDQYSVSGTTVTFTSAIPLGVSNIMARIGRSTEINIPATDSVQQSHIANGFALAPSGAVIDWPNATAPTGFLECNGATVSRTTYANIFAVIGEDFGAGDGSTTFVLPDCRGEFRRGWDNGRGIDSGRAINSYQGEAIGPHTHNYDRTRSKGISTDPGGSSGFRLWDDGTSYDTTATSDGGGTETRPRNVAMMAIIAV